MKIIRTALANYVQTSKTLNTFIIA
jgi:hypothetical protein